MHLFGKLALGGSVVSTATVGWLVAAGVFTTGATLVVADPVPRPAQADELTAFDSCSALLDWYVRRGVRDVGPYGWAGPIFWADTRLMRSAGTPVAGALDTVGSSATGTNTQEADVDEPDVAKTDGSLIARIVGDRRLVLVDVAHGEPRVIHRLWLPQDGSSNELLLIGHHVLIAQTTYADQGGGPRPTADARYLGYRGATGTRILDVDISDPHAPRLLSHDTYSGSLVSLRQYGDTVRLVTSTPRPELGFVMPHRGVSKKQALTRNRALVRASTIEDWLPSVTRDGTRRTLTDCSEVYHPQEWSGADTVAVTTFGIDDVADSGSVAVTASGEVVYSSADRLYVASTNWQQDAGDTPRCQDCLAPRGSAPVTTDLHAFALDGTATTYVGSGHVAGTVRDRWSLDEYGGNLRVAWSRTGPRGGTRNGITVLAEHAGRLEPVGTVEDLGPDENIQSVRWFDDLAIVVTFRQVDPLYTVDLTDPAHPRTLGALRIPGFSGYLHPLGGGLVLGLGSAATERGSVTGSQAAVFDISDPTHPLRVSRAPLGADTWISAVDDPHGFTWVPGQRTGVTAVTSWNTGRAHLVALTVGETGAMTSRVLADLNRDWQARTLALPDGRLAVLDSHRVRVVDLP